MEQSVILLSKNRGPLQIKLSCLEGKVQRIEVGTSTSGKNIRMVFIETDKGVQQFKFSHPTINIKEDQEISVIYYETEGFIKKVAGFHNHSKKGSYFLSQPKDYFESWLQVRPIGPVVLYAFVLPILVSAIVMYYAFIVGIILAVLSLIAGIMFYLQSSKKYILVSGVHLKSVLLQLMDAFKEYASFEEDA